MNELEIIEKIRSRVTAILGETGLIQFIDPDTQDWPSLMSHIADRTTPDFMLAVNTASNVTYGLIFGVKAQGQPRYAEMVANRFAAARTDGNDNWYGVFGAPYLSTGSIDICRKNGIGCLDLAGNCFLKFDGVYIEIQGKPNPYPDKRPLKSIFYQKAARVLRILLSDPHREWLVKDLAEAANVSIGQTSNVKSRLMDYGFIEEAKLDHRTFYRLIRPEALLREWAQEYCYRHNESSEYYSLDKIEVIENKLAEYCEKTSTRYAFSLTSGAALVAPFVRYKRVFAYVDGEPDVIATASGWKKVASGANISLMKPRDEGFYYGARDINGRSVVSDVQLYLDLQRYEPRGEEAAEQVLSLLEKRWLQGQIIRQK